MAHSLPWQYWDPGFTSPDRAFFVGGCGRSGTTLLRLILNAHRNLYCGPESWLFVQAEADCALLADRFHVPFEVVRTMASEANSRQEFAVRLLARAAGDDGKPRWGDKTPRNVRMFPQLCQSFPNGKVLHVVRDGRDVICSLRTHPRFKQINGVQVPTNIVQPWEACIHRWVTDVEAGVVLRSHPRYLEVRYEQLVTQPSATIGEVLAFLEEPFDAQCLSHHLVNRPSTNPAHFPQNPEGKRPIYQDVVGRWRSELPARQLEMFYRQAAPLMERLRY